MIPHESPHESTSLFHLLSFAFQSDQPDPLLVPLVSGVFTWIGRLTFGTLLLFVEEGGAIFTIFNCSSSAISILCCVRTWKRKVPLWLAV